MRYILLAYGDAGLATLPSAEQEALRAACEANDEALRRSGHLLSVEGLEGSASTLRLRDGALLVAEGPLAVCGESLLGIFVIDARDLNEVIQLASHMPQLRGGPIEVRPAWAGR